MSPRILAGLLGSVVLVAAPPGPSAASQPAPRLKLAVLPCTKIETTSRKFHPLLAYLESAAGLVVTLVVPGEFAEFETTMANGQVDFALQDPHTYQQVSRLLDDTSLLQTRALDGTTRQSGVVVVRRDSGITDLVQLRGRSVMFGPRISSPKWIAAKLLFESKGIAVDRDLKGIAGGCCEDIAFAVSVRSVDGGVICGSLPGPTPRPTEGPRGGSRTPCWSSAGPPLLLHDGHRDFRKEVHHEIVQRTFGDLVERR